MNKSCVWCGSEAAKTMNGWVPFKSHNKNIPDFLYFCSKKCLAAATVNGKGTCLDLNKIARKQRHIQQKIESVQMRDLMQKEKLSKEDLPQLFLCLTAKQKKALALIGLSHMLWSVHWNPKELMMKTNDLAKLL